MEVMRFCQSFMTELYEYIGADQDVPAGDIGVGGREIRYLFGQYKRITGLYEGVLTGKGLTWGGSLVRTQATGYGAIYILDEMLKQNGKELAGKTVLISGSGNVAVYATKKCQQLGAKVVAMNDSNGYIYDPNGIPETISSRTSRKSVVDGLRNMWKRFTAYAKVKASGPFLAISPFPVQPRMKLIWRYKTLVAGGVMAVVEGSNMPTTLEATEYFQENGILFMPGKAANAGGVATSALEMSQNSQRLSWTFEEVG